MPDDEDAEDRDEAEGELVDDVPAVRALTCFVVGPIGNRLAPHGSDERRTYEEALEVYSEVIEPACKENGLQPVRADGLLRAGEITEQVFLRLRDDDVVIADLTGANANVMYELGLRHTKNKLTVPIGEYGRLPFDVTVIRTIMFSRSPIGLINARKELSQFLEAGLAGEFDPVSATRVWNDLDENGEAGSPADLPEKPPPDGSPELTPSEHNQEELPGFVEVLAEAEEAQERLNRTAHALAADIERLGGLAEESTSKMAESDAAGLGMKARLVHTIQFAQGLSKVADDFERHVADHAEAMASVSQGNLVLIRELEKHPELLETREGAAWDFARVVRGVAATARETTANLNSLGETMAENAKLARALRPPTKRILSAIDQYTKANAVVDEWDRHLQALGVPIPDEDWMLDLPEAEAGLADDSSEQTDDGAEAERKS